jgi:hypothetical protein
MSKHFDPIIFVSKTDNNVEMKIEKLESRSEMAIQNGFRLSVHQESDSTLDHRNSMSLLRLYQTISEQNTLYY